MDTPKISVITVCFNSAKTIKDTLNSVTSQTYKNLEHIIVDGRSSDGTMAIIESNRDGRSTVISEPDQGIYDAMNKGLKVTTGEVVGFLNADDVYVNEDVLQQVAQVFTNPGVDACYADLVYVDHNDLQRVVRYWKSCEYRDGLFEEGWMPAHPTFFVRNKIYKKYGGFDLAFKLQSDFELTLRFLRVHHIKAVYIPQIFVKMRTGGTSSRFMNILRGNLEAWRACQKHALNVGPFFIFSKIVSRLPQFFAKPK